VLEYFPCIYPDEIFYSAIARYRIHTHSNSYRETIYELFQTYGVTAVIDLSNRIRNIFERIPVLKRSYEEEAILIEHTMFPFYSAFIGDTLRSELVVNMLGDQGNSVLRMKMGLVSGPVFDARLLKYCPVCMTKDLETYGEAYWHRIHQVPGVLVCPYHSAYLQDKCIGCGDNFRAESQAFVALTDRCICGQYFLDQRTLVEDDNLFQKQMQYATNAAKLLAGDVIFDPTDLQQIYTMRLKELGFTCASGSLRSNDIIQEFCRYYGQDFLEQMQSTLTTVANNWIVNYLRNQTPRLHPVRQLLLIQWLYGSVENLPSAPKKYHPFGDAPWPCLNAAVCHYGEDIISECIIKRGGQSHKLIGVFACDCGFTYCRSGPDSGREDRYRISKVLKYGDIWKNKARQLVNRDGVPIRAVARELKTSPTIIRKYAKELKTTIISSDSQIDKGQQRRKLYRSVALTFVAGNPQLLRKEIYSQITKEYAWLWKYDYDWFISVLPLAREMPLGRNRKPTKDWGEIDLIIYPLVETATKEILDDTLKPQRVTIGNIERRIGRGKRLYKILHKLPRTSELLNECLESVEDFRIRRMKCKESLRVDPNLTCPPSVTGRIK